MKATLSLFYLLLFFLPIQLGRHFSFPFSFISGIRSDYLLPTLFLTDILILLIFVSAIFSFFKKKKKFLLKQKGKTLLIFSLIVFAYLLFSSFFASNFWVAFYKLLKITEFFFLGLVIIRLKPSFLTSFFFLSLSVAYSSMLAVGQFFWQKSLGGFFWWLGERTFYAATPGIANFSFNGRLVLRSYATFPHPNVLGGFLALFLPLALFLLLAKAKSLNKVLYFWFLLAFLLGFIALFFTFSRAAWIATVFGILMVILERQKKITKWLKEKIKLFLVLFYTLLIFSIVIPLIFSRISFLSSASLKERAELISASFKLIEKAPFLGVGLNNFILKSGPFLKPALSFFLFQPVHNIYLLVFAETGVIGLFIFLIGLVMAFKRSLKNFPLLSLSLIQLYLLGFFDHYLFTLQQSQLLLTIFLSLAISSPGLSFPAKTGKLEKDLRF